MMQQRAAPASFGAEAASQHLHHVVKFFPGKISVRPGLPHQLEKFLLLPVLAGGGGDDLLREDIERFLRNVQAIQFAACDAPQQCR